MANPKKTTLPVLNLHEVTFECTFGRGCDGVCCRNGRPPVSAEEAARLDANLGKFLPLLSPRARRAVEEGGYASRRVKAGMPMLRVVDGWCVFFHQGCVLHKVGALEGDMYRYKPAACALFPLARDEQDRWYVRQWGYKGEEWDIFCLNPEASPLPAANSLQSEIELARFYTEQEQQVATGS